MIYLDSAATTMQKPRCVSAAAAAAVCGMASPGRGAHAAAMYAAETAYRCRQLAAKLFNVPEPDNAVLTFNATHGLNMAVRSLVSGGSKVVVSGYEHNAVMRPLYDIGCGIKVARSSPFDADGTLEAFDDLIRPDTGAVICTHVSNVFGYILPIEEIASICRERGVPFVIDASQSAGSIDIDFTALGARYIAMPGHKGLYGPQGTGLLLCEDTPVSLMLGGTGGNSKSRAMPDYLPDGAEAGTHNMPGITGLVKGLEFVMRKTPAAIMAHERSLISRAADALHSAHGLTVYRSGDSSLQGGVLSFAHESITSEAFADMMSDAGIAVRGGLHCAPLAHETAGTDGSGTVRISVSAFNTQAEIDAAVRVIRRIAAGEK